MSNSSQVWIGLNTVAATIVVDIPATGFRIALRRLPVIEDVTAGLGGGRLGRQFAQPLAKPGIELAQGRSLLLLSHRSDALGVKLAFLDYSFDNVESADEVEGLVETSALATVGRASDVVELARSICAAGGFGDLAVGEDLIVTGTDNRWSYRRRRRIIRDRCGSRAYRILQATEWAMNYSIRLIICFVLPISGCVSDYQSNRYDPYDTYYYRNTYQGYKDRKEMARSQCLGLDYSTGTYRSGDISNKARKKIQKCLDNVGSSSFDDFINNSPFDSNH